MLSYVTIGVTDLEKSEAFYNELLAPIGAKTLIKMERIIYPNHLKMQIQRLARMSD